MQLQGERAIPLQDAENLGRVVVVVFAVVALEVGVGREKCLQKCEQRLMPQREARGLQFLGSREWAYWKMHGVPDRKHWRKAENIEKYGY